jgi:hypothetical protein
LSIGGQSAGGQEQWRGGNGNATLFSQNHQKENQTVMPTKELNDLAHTILLVDPLLK